MKACLCLFLAAAATSLVCAAETPSSRLHAVDAQTAAGLHELLKPAPSRLPLISAHRGGAGRALPENCLATFQATTGQAWSMLEIDLHFTKDGVLVLMHDPTLDRTSNGKGAIKDYTRDELRAFRLKDRQGNLTDYPIPTLEEALVWARGKTLLVLDKKDVAVKDIVPVIARHHAESYALIMTYAIKDITECHALNPDIMMEVMVGTTERFAEFDRCGVPWANIVAFVGHTATPDRELCRRIHEKGASCMAGTSRNLDREFLSGRVKTMEALKPQYEAVLASGVDIIETDIPRDLGPLIHPTTQNAGGKARFFRPAP